MTERKNHSKEILFLSLSLSNFAYVIALFRKPVKKKKQFHSTFFLTFFFYTNPLILKHIISTPNTHIHNRLPIKKKRKSCRNPRKEATPPRRKILFQIKRHRYVRRVDLRFSTPSFAMK